MNPLTRFSPFLSRLRKHVGLPNGYQETASRSWTISPAVHSCVPPAIFEASDLAKVTGGSPGLKRLEDEFDRATGKTGTHGATVAYELRNAVLSRGHLFTMRTSHPISAHAAVPLFAFKIAAEYSEAALATSWLGIRYFGHWMTDDLPRLLAARTIGHPVSQMTAPTPAQRDYIKLFCLQADTVTDAFFRRIVILDDFGQNDYKRERFSRLQQSALPHGVPGRAAKVMLLRGNSGVRRVLVNELELAQIAKARGFQVMDPAVTDAAEILRWCVNASVVLGVEGSQLANGILWMSPKGTLVILEPPQRFSLVLKDYCDCIGIRCAFIVGDQAGDEDFRVDPTAFQRLLDRVH